MAGNWFLVFLIIAADAGVAYFVPFSQASSIPPHLQFVAHASFFFMSGSAAAVLLVRGMCGRNASQKAVATFDDPARAVSLTLAKRPFNFKMPSRLSYRMFREAVESYNSGNFVSCITLCHSSVEHAVIAELYGGYKPDESFGNPGLARPYGDKWAEIVKKLPSLSAQKDTALKLWNLNRLTYVQTPSEPPSAGAVDERDKARRKEYESNEENLLVGVESLADEALFAAAEVHSSISTLY